MPKTLTAETETSQQNETKRQRKKQAKQEAKIMLKVEQAQKEVRKAQKKLTRAQSNLDERQTHLHKLEEHLQQIRTPEDSQAQASQTPSNDASETQPEVSQAQEINQAADFEPAEDRIDTTTDSAPVATSPEEQPPTQAESDEQNAPSPEAIAETDTTSPEESVAMTTEHEA